MEVLEAIKGRRSIRAFRNDAVSQEAVEKRVDAATWAPSAGNVQPWEFVVVKKPETKRRLAEAALEQSFVEEAPVRSIGYAEDSDGIRPVAMIPAGYPAESPQPRSKRPMKQVVHYEIF